MFAFAGIRTDRFSPIVVPVLEEFLEAVGWKGQKIKVEINVHEHAVPETGRGVGVASEVVWIVPNPNSVRPDHPSYALATVCLGPRDRHFTCYLPHGKLGRHPSGLRHTECTLTKVLRARFTFSRMSEAEAVQMKGLGHLL